MGSVDTVVFDVGGVVIHWDPRNLYRKLFEHEADMEHFLAEVCTTEWNLRQDEGRPLHEATELLVARHPGSATLIRAFYGRWEEMLGGLVEGTAELIRDLRKGGYRVLALSNFSAENFPRAQALYPVLNAFDGVVLSGAEGLIKPDPAIYNRLTRRFGNGPERTVFLDDSPANVEGARQVGWHAFLFHSAAQARVDLRTLGIQA